MSLRVTRKREAYGLALTIAVGAIVIAVGVGLVVLSSALPSELQAAKSVLDKIVIATMVLTSITVVGPFGLYVSLQMLHAHELGEKMRSIALTDQLTGLPNRFAVLDQIQQAVAQSGSDGKHGALLFIDLDHFKMINDRHGHLGGDAALRHASKIMRETKDPDMILGRFGGEEFICFSPDAATAASTAMAIVMSLRATSALHEGVAIPVTASIGIAVMGDAMTTEALLENADRALYLAKSAGRDRIVHHDDIAALEGMARRMASAGAAPSKDRRSGSRAS